MQLTPSCRVSSLPPSSNNYKDRETGRSAIPLKRCRLPDKFVSSRSPTTHISAEPETTTPHSATLRGASAKRGTPTRRCPSAATSSRQGWIPRSMWRHRGREKANVVYDLELDRKHDQLLEIQDRFKGSPPQRQRQYFYFKTKFGALR